MTLHKNLQFAKLVCRAGVVALVALFALLPVSGGYAASLPTGIDVLGYTGITVNTPDIVDENPSMPDHTRSISIEFFPYPTATVTVTVTPTNGQCTVSQSTLVIPAGQSSATLSVSGVNDGVLEAPLHACPIRFDFASADIGYNGATRTPVVQVRDWNLDLIISNNRPINENSLALNHTNSLRATLSDRPSGDIFITLTNDTAQCIFSTLTFTLTPTNWNTGVLLPGTAVDDKIVEQPTHPCSTTFSSSTASSVEWRSRTKLLTIDVVDYNIIPLVITPPKIIETGAKLLLAPIIGTALVYLLWFVAFRASQRRSEETESIDK